MELDLKKMKVVDKRNSRVYDVQVDSNGVIEMIQPLNFETENSWCYNNYPKNCERFGRLYDWWAAVYIFKDHVACDGMTSGVCPEGWKVSENGVMDFYAGFRTEEGAFGGIGESQVYWGNESAPTNREGCSCSYDFAFCKAGCAEGKSCNWFGAKSNKSEAFSVHCAFKGAKVPEGVELPKSDYVVPKYEYPDISNEYSGPYGELVDERDGNVYKTVKIGSQTWMAENLRFEIEESYCLGVCKGKEETLGRHYRWATANKLSNLSFSPDTVQWPIQGVCPDGWHIPTYDDWQVLFDYVLEQTDGVFLGKALQSKEPWFEDETEAGYNTFGFNVLFSGTMYEDLDGFGWYNYKVVFMVSDSIKSKNPRHVVGFLNPSRHMDPYYDDDETIMYYPNVRCILGKGYRPIYPPKPKED